MSLWFGLTLLSLGTRLFFNNSYLDDFLENSGNLQFLINRRLEFISVFFLTPSLIGYTQHLFPSFTSYIIVDLIISFPYIVLAETALSLIGLGLRRPSMSWGVLMQDMTTLSAIQQTPWYFIPLIFFSLAILGFVLVGDGLRQAADPYSQMKR